MSGSLDTSIRVWDVETGNCIHTLTGHQSLTSGMELKDNILVSGNADSTVKIWDIKTGQCLQTLQGEPRSNQKPSKYQHGPQVWVQRARLIPDYVTRMSARGSASPSPLPLCVPLQLH